MKDNNRTLSAVFFALAFGWMALCMRMALTNMGLANSPMQVGFEFAALFVFGWVVVKAFARTEPFTCAQKRQLCALVGVYFVVNLAAIDLEQQIVVVTLSGFNQSLAQNTALSWAVLAVKFVFLAAALYFACAEKKQATVVFDEGAAPEELESEEAMEQLTERLLAANTARQEAEQQIMAEAEAQLAADPARQDDPVILVWGEGFHPGVIGIVASRLVERYGRPAMVISVQNGEGKGSGRSVPGFNLHSAIAACAPLLVRFGGHAQAAGLSVEEKNIPALQKALNEFAVREYPVPEAPPLELDVDCLLYTSPSPRDRG